jgi:hypothetical protein
MDETLSEPPSILQSNGVDNDRDMRVKRSPEFLAWLFYCPKPMAYGVPTHGLFNACIGAVAGVVDTDS